MPLTTGPGSIATAISLVAAYQDGKSLNLLKELPAVLGTVAALISLSVVIYVVYRESSGIQKVLGPAGTNAVMRLFAFILLAIGVQIFLGGAQAFAIEVIGALHAH
jgi:multiple antibiotic resistance protein